jgi:hypothetical protein
LRSSGEDEAFANRHCEYNAHSEHHTQFTIQELDNVQGVSTHHRKHALASNLHKTQSSLDDQQKRCRLEVSEEVDRLSDRNSVSLGDGIVALERVLSRIAEEVREDRQETNLVLKEIARKLDNFTPGM